MATSMSMELRDLIERNAQIQEMSLHPGWELLCDYVRAQMMAKQRSLLLGNADSLEEYREQVGWLQGVTAVLNAPQSLAEQVTREQQKEREHGGAEEGEG
jgi:hypothetical protein